MAEAREAREKVAATVTIHRAGEMSPRGRKAVARWLRAQADYVERFPKTLGPRYRARYLYR